MNGAWHRELKCGMDSLTEHRATMVHAWRRWVSHGLLTYALRRSVTCMERSMDPALKALRKSGGLELLVFFQAKVMRMTGCSWRDMILHGPSAQALHKNVHARQDWVMHGHYQPKHCMSWYMQTAQPVLYLFQQTRSQQRQLECV